MPNWIDGVLYPDTKGWRFSCGGENPLRTTDRCPGRGRGVRGSLRHLAGPYDSSPLTPVLASAS